MIIWKTGGSARLYQHDKWPDNLAYEWFNFSISHNGGDQSELTSSVRIPSTDPFTGSIEVDWPTTGLTGSDDCTVKTDAFGVTLIKSGAAVLLRGSSQFSGATNDFIPLTAVWNFQRDSTWTLRGVSIRYSSIGVTTAVGQSLINMYMVFGSRREAYPLWDPTVSRAATVSTDSDDISWSCNPFTLRDTDGAVVDDYMLLRESETATKDGYDSLTMGGLYPQNYPNIGEHELWPESDQDSFSLVLDFPPVESTFTIYRVGLIIGVN